MPRLGLAVAFADLGFNLFDRKIYRCIQVFFAIFSEQVRTSHCEFDGAGELFFRCAVVIVFKRDACVNRPLVEVIKLFDFGHDVIFDCFCQGDSVRYEDQFHISMMQLTRNEIQRKKVIAKKN